VQFGNTHLWKPLQSNVSEDVTVDTSVCVTASRDIIMHFAHRQCLCRIFHMFLTLNSNNFIFLNILNQLDSNAEAGCILRGKSRNFKYYLEEI
jgi:hypothetical protein